MYIETEYRKPGKILLVEDEVIIAIDEADILTGNGFEVVMAYSADEALAIIDKTPVDLILMDIDLGDKSIDGTELAEIILRTHDIPIVFMSCHTEPEIVAKTEKITSYGYIVKNSNETVLIASIKMAFKLYESQQERLKKSHQLNTLLDNAEDYIGMLDRNRVYLYVNKALCNAVGIPYEKYVGKTVSELGYPEELTEKWNNAIDTVFQTGKAARFEFVIPGSTGDKIFDCSIFPELLENGELKTIVAISRNITDQKKSEELFFKAFQSSPLLMSISTIEDGRYLQVNDNFCLGTGYSREEILGKTSVELGFISQKARSTLKERLFSEGSVEGMEFTFNHRSGKIFHCLYYGEIIEVGGKKRLLSLVQDITERKEMELKLQEREAILNQSQEIANIGSFVWDLRNDDLKWSENMFAIAGLDPNRFYGNLQETINAMIHPEDRESILKQIEEMVTQKRTWSMNFRLVRPDGSICYLRSRSRFVFDDADNPVTSIGVHYDVTEQKRIEEDLSLSETRYRTIVQTAMDGFVITDMQGHLLDVNEAYCRMLGYSKEELLTMSVNDFEARENPDEMKAHIDKLIEQGYDRFDTVHRRKDGLLLNVEVSATYIPANDGIVVSFFRDTTERSKAEEERSLNEARLEALLKLHDMQNATSNELAQFALEESER